MFIQKIENLFIKKIEDISRKGLKNHLERIVNKYNLPYAGFVSSKGASAGRPLIYYPEDLLIHKELSGKIVGLINDITNLKITKLDSFTEIIFSNSREYIYLKKIQPHIMFYCGSHSYKQIKKLIKFLLKNEDPIKKIFTKD
ncbi:MAG: hypothetical protein EU550_03005 [Promethearchaeota archaeon]|nr:MAG: hypothetical protein EU550_03005 [Candidatus Lokiarchaeota archaeon]